MAKDQCGKILISRGGTDPAGRRGARSQGAAVSSWGWEVEPTASRKADSTSFQNCQDAFQLMNKKRSLHRFQHHENREERERVRNGRISRCWRKDRGRKKGDPERGGRQRRRKLEGMSKGMKIRT